MMSYWSLDKRCYLQYCRHFLVDNNAFHVERCMSVMQSGTQMIKLKSGTKGLVRLFYLDEHRTCIRWRPSRKSEKAKIIIDSIYKVTEGRQSELFHRHAEGNFDPSCCFTIYHGNHMESVDLITSNPEEARTWITGLKYLMAGISDEDSLAKRQRTHDQWVKQTFQEADKNRDGLLNIEEIYQLMHKLNVNLPRRKVRQMFQEADTDENQGTLTFEEFSVFYKMMSLRRDLYLLLLSYSDKKDHLTVEELSQFLKVEQKMNVTVEYCLDIIKKFEVSEENKEQNILGIEGFTSFMRSPAGDIFNPLHCEVYQDMDQPLCNYYIASSHNTYLTGDQLLSQSKVDMYAWVLQDGCRCVEVDCWDGPDGEPVVHHGYTLTSKILFRDVVEAINKHAFVKNEYPVVLSIENHCSIQQQQKIALYMKEIFGDKLDLSSVQMGESKQLPSPQSLKGKILVKGKKLPYHLGEDAEEGEVSDEDSADEIEDECKLTHCFSNGTTEHQVESFIRKKLESLLRESQIRDKEDPDSFTVRALLKATHEGLNVNLKENSGVKEKGKKSHGRSLMSNLAKHKKTTKSKSKSHSIDDDEDEQQDCPGKETGQLPRLGHRRKTMKLCRALSDLVVYTNSVSAHDVVDDGTTGNVLSFSETRAHQVVQQKSEQFMQYNQKQLTRIYPSAYRIDSSNFNPLPYWNAGIQLVALNYQTEGRMMQLNRAKFKMNGNCGYVLKPQQMCKGVLNPFSSDPLPASPKKQLILKVISGQQLPKPPDSMLGDRGEIIDPFVEVEIIGLPVDCCKAQTRVVDDNGFNPVWEETLTFTVHMPEIALVRFLVWDHDPIGRDFVGQRTVAFGSLMPGYRHVYLEGLTEASIFVHITINEIYGKNRQFMGLKGLFNKNPKHNSLDNSNACIRKRSIGDRILRRTASAPAKGRKKTKMGFQETTDFKDTASETFATKDKEVVIRRNARSLQARPVSMPVDRFLLGGLAPPTAETIKKPERKENTSESSECTSKSTIMSEPEENASICHCSSLPRKGSSQSSFPAVSNKELIVQEQLRNSNFANGRLEEDPTTECFENQLSSPFKSRNHVEKMGRFEIQKSKEQKYDGLEKCLDQKAFEIENVEYDIKDNPIRASFSLSDVSTAANASIPDLHSAPVVQDSDISCLIGEVSSTNGSELGNSISALIGQFDVTEEKTNLTFVSSLHCTSNQTLISGYSHMSALAVNTPEKQTFSAVNTVELSSYSLADTTVFSSPETTEYSVYAIVHEEILSPASDYRSLDEIVSNKLHNTEENLPVSDCVSPLHLLETKPTKGLVTSWEALENCRGSYTSNNSASECFLLDPAVDSDDSSPMEIGESQDLLTSYECEAENVNQLGSPLKLNYNQDITYGSKTKYGNNLLKAYHPNSAVNRTENFKNAAKHQSPYPVYQSLDFDDDHLQKSGTPNDFLLISQRARLCNTYTAASNKQLPFHSAATIKYSSPCKSKSLGDLTSEDISCNFESKYKCISRSFISAGIEEDIKVASWKSNRPQSTDTLTEQLRKLVSFDQEDCSQSLHCVQNDADFPKPLVRKLSSRSQSRVRHIASRAKERQEANKQKLANSNIAGVILRNKSSPSPHAVNRHSTGSYIAGYLSNFNRDMLEDLGTPESSCTPLNHGHNDPFYTDDSVLQIESSTADEPEIYFLLRL
ncbi:1-phosphatidylinositol 4,5-bisphosphate phosphodiesterase eta-1 isoform X2 [Rhinatrema bivittatum]|uniref:1-phosphatidylinositol 4,5-bisphosphate phosphodiesterase eta-1 isoform X2 n=1 Tax=Rhinatrema bivittatum TaxID=194408 RepID=UPI00112D36FF|nr:1-phosphatidylinositol 4,5-bisphosphate phosphodiesterase eta-1 isoform X2 [Rhinatrema bivittatum]